MTGSQCLRLSKNHKQNPAHCDIRNISRRTENSYINQLRVTLVKIPKMLNHLEAFLGKYDSKLTWGWRKTTTSF